MQIEALGLGFEERSGIEIFLFNIRVYMQVSYVQIYSIAI